MDTLSLAEQSLNEQYNNVKYMFCISDAKHEAQFFTMNNQAGNTIIKMLLFTNHTQETIIYDIKQGEIFYLSQ
ncbi:MAG: hypothetical protein JST75_14940 [Bacteroidetes bacterium]|nr:hypothetical protein [Bacteroidota bacterium]